LENQFYKELCQILPKEQIKEKEPMSEHTSLHIGGAAEYLLTPMSVCEVGNVISLCKSHGMPYYIMGNGSNLLVADSGYPGVIVQLGEDFASIRVDENGQVTAQAGALLSKIANVVAEHSLTGFELASGSPGT